VLDVISLLLTCLPQLLCIDPAVTMLAKYLLSCAGLWVSTLACEGCSHASNEDVVLTRLRPRMQPDALGAPVGPKGPLSWGQLNVLHTTDTHGWLEGHIKEQNYGADWG